MAGHLTSSCGSSVDAQQGIKLVHDMLWATALSTQLPDHPGPPQLPTFQHLSAQLQGCLLRCHIFAWSQQRDPVSLLWDTVCGTMWCSNSLALFWPFGLCWCWFHEQKFQPLRKTALLLLEKQQSHRDAEVWTN